MPLSELHHATRPRLESSQSKPPNLPSDLPPNLTESDFLELLWENGQIVMQGQSSRPKKSPLSSVVPSHSTRFLEKDNGDVVTPRGGRAVIGSAGGNFAPTMIPGTVALNGQEDDIAPWLNDSLDDYYSELLSDFTGVNSNPFPGNGSNLSLVDKGPVTVSMAMNQVSRDPFDAEFHPQRLPVVSSNRTGIANQLPQPWQNSIPNSKSKPLDFAGPGTSVLSEQNPSWELPITKAPPRQDVSSSRPPVPPAPSTSTSVINFSHFSRPASLLKANLQTSSKLRCNTVVSNPIDSTLINSPTVPRTTTQDQLPSVSCKPGLRSTAQPPLEFAAGTRNGNAVSSNNITDKRLPEKVQVQKMGSVPIAVSPQNGQRGTEKASESVMAPSSVCSGNGGAVESCDPVHGTKRKATEEESGYQSEDVEDESFGAKKPTTTRSTSSKRSRAAEVHNRSERRRRDRINEKMRALQELIPNCNKADKASMLDEAIEYLKTLQLQVQMMSMGGGFSMPPMMLPPAMQRLRPPHMFHFPPMGVGVGMGMGVGYGMGMVDMNGTQMIPLPPVPNSQFPCSSMGVASGLHSVPQPSTSAVPMFGIPSQGVPVPMHCTPPFVSLAAHSSWPTTAPEVVCPISGSLQSATVNPSDSKDPSEQNTGTEENQQVPRRSHPTMDGIERSSSIPTNDQASNSDGPANSCSGNGNSSSGASYD